MSRPREFEVLWAEAAIQDLERIVDFVAQEAPLAAERLFNKTEERSSTLETLPFRGRIVPELARFDITTFRELIVSPHRLLCRIDGQRVVAFSTVAATSRMSYGKGWLALPQACSKTHLPPAT